MDTNLSSKYSTLFKIIIFLLLTTNTILYYLADKIDKRFDKVVLALIFFIIGITTKYFRWLLFACWFECFIYMFYAFFNGASLIQYKILVETKD